MCRRLMLQLPGYDHRNAFMVFFLVHGGAICMVTQRLAARRWPQRPPVAPAISTELQLAAAGWTRASAVASLAGAALAGITPWVPGTAFAFSFIACLPRAPWATLS